MTFLQDLLLSAHLVLPSSANTSSEPIRLRAFVLVLEGISEKHPGGCYLCYVPMLPMEEVDEVIWAFLVVWLAPLQLTGPGAISPPSPGSPSSAPLPGPLHAFLLPVLSLTCPHVPQFPTCCFPQNSKPLRSSWAAAPARATTAVHVIIICAHDPQLPTVRASQICL